MPSLRPWRTCLPLLTLLAVTLVVFAPGAASPVAADGPAIKIAVVGTLSSPVGLSMIGGVRLAFEEIKEKRGVGGRGIVLVEINDQGNAEFGATLIRKLIQEQEVVAVLGPSDSGVALASYKIAMEAKVPLLLTVSASPPVNELFKEYHDNYIFRIAMSDDVQAQWMVGAAVGKLGLEKVAFVCDAYYGQSGCSKMSAALGSRGGKAVYEGKIKYDQPRQSDRASPFGRDFDITTQLQQARSAGAQALLVYGSGPQLAEIANARQKLGYEVPMIGNWTLSTPSFIEAAGQNGDGAIMPQTFIQKDASSAKAKRFIENYQSRNHVHRIPSAVAAAQGYDAMYLIAAAIDQAGSSDGSKIKAALENLQRPYEGVIATFAKPFSTIDHEAIHLNHVVMGRIRRGEVEGGSVGGGGCPASNHRCDKKCGSACIEGCCAD